MNFLTTKSKYLQPVWGLLWLGVIFIVAGCNSFWSSAVTPGQDDHSFMARLEHGAVLTAEDAEHQADTHGVNIEHLLTELEYISVQPQGGVSPDNLSPVDVAPFFTLARKSEITQYPCSNCHVESLEILQSRVSSDVTQAHWDITLNHANETVMNCLTCHTDDDMDSLHTLTDQPVNFDASYQLCAQCHGQQYEDWQGGAHGKQVGGWAPPRVVNNCVNCHNPHQPNWETRWPAVTNTSPSE